MDIEQFKKLSTSKIEAGRKTRAIRNTLKKYDEEKQDAYEGVSETYKPLTDIQKSVKESIDEKQDKLITQLQENQKAITSGLEDIVLYNQLPEIQVQDTKLPIDYKPAMMDKSPPKYKSDLDKGFNTADIQTFTKYNLFAPSDVLRGVRSEEINFENYKDDLNHLINKLGVEKAPFSKKNKKNKK